MSCIQQPMTVDIEEFFSISNYYFFTGFEPSKSLPFTMVYELREEEGITEGLWKDLYSQRLCSIVPWILRLSEFYIKWNFKSHC